MRNKIVFILSGLGILLALYGAYVFSKKPPAQVPVFNPAPNPYGDGIYANGIIESSQSEGENINIYPEVAGPIVSVQIKEGEFVTKGTVLLAIEDSVQRAIADQQQSQAEAALAMLNELKAQPRPETLDVAMAQINLAVANQSTVQNQLAKLQAAFEKAPGAVSRDELDTAKDAVHVAENNLVVAHKQYDLLKAGAWSFDIQNQQKQYEALTKAYKASDALLNKYQLKAPGDGVILSIEATVGSYVSPQGAYGTYTQGLGPVITMGGKQDLLQVRCFVDEILVHRLPATSKMTAKMFILGTDISVPLTFERLQPFVSPKIELSNQRAERVDVRVLPVIFRFAKPTDLIIFPGQLVDVYIGEQKVGVPSPSVR